MHKLTLYCNSRCVHCDIWKKEYPDDELTTMEVKCLYEQLRSWLGPYNLVITGGEALMRTDAIEVAVHAAQLGLIVDIPFPIAEGEQLPGEWVQFQGPA